MIENLKREAAKHYLAYHAEADRGDYSCGMNLAAVINTHLSENARKFNHVMDELAKIDPACPKGRLPVGSP